MDVPIRLSVNSTSSSSKQSPQRLSNIEELDFADLGLQLEPREETSLLLSVGAEIEHALMVQYLFAAYSVCDDHPNNEQGGIIKGLSDQLLQIAREEMGHFITVQNLLQLIGAPMHFGRQHSPFASTLYPFRFKLERLSSSAIAKYVVAESPVERPPSMTDAEWRELGQLAKTAQAANDGQPVRHVGSLYARLIDMFQNRLADEDFVVDRPGYQARYADWGFDPGSSDPADRSSRRVQVDSFTDVDPARQRDNAVAALEELAEQGEGFGIGIDSHFQRFLSLYRQFKDLEGEGASLTWPVATNPTIVRPLATTDWDTANLATAAQAAFQAKGYISHQRSRNWAELFNMRYQLLLICLRQFLSRSDALYRDRGVQIGDPTERGLLLIWSFDEMRRLKKIARKLVQLPQHSDSDLTRAAAPFQLPFSFSAAEFDLHRWRQQLDTVRSAIKLIDRMRKAQDTLDRNDPFLDDLESADQKREAILSELSRGNEVPDSALPKNFSKVVHILEQAVRGFSINVHGNFWSGKTRDQFVGQHIFNTPLFEHDAGDDCRLTSSDSYLVRITRRRMPAYRPSIPSVRHQYLQNWVDDQTPDNHPPGQVGLRTEATPSTEPASAGASAGQLLTNAGVISYRNDVRPLFGEFDEVTLKRFDRIDINDVESVRRRVTHLLKQLQLGKLPYYANWSQTSIDLFEAWKADGMKE
ncbi:MAG: hypothetical protein JXQ99_05685 [Hyphomicrobiaceae bacterium]